MTPTILVRRDVFGSDATLGAMYWMSRPFGWSCEDEDRGLDKDMPLTDIRALKVMAETAIPAGLYRVKTTWSRKYKRMMPQVMNVPGFSGIRIHSGNDDDDTAGCILPGLDRDIEQMAVLRSRVACRWLDKAIAAKELLDEEVTLLIERDAKAWAARGRL